MPTSTQKSGPEPCKRCSQLTRTFWVGPDGGCEAWCNFCIAAQVMSYVGSARCQAFAAAFSGGIDSGKPEEVRSVSVALRGLATMLHDRPPE